MYFQTYVYMHTHIHVTTISGIGGNKCERKQGDVHMRGYGEKN